MPKNPEIFRLLNSFSNKDYTDFAIFLKSPYVNNRKALICIFDCIKKYKNLMPDNCDKLEALLSKGSKYSKNTITKLLSYLRNSVLEYFSINNILYDKILLKLKLGDRLLKSNNLKLLKLNQQKIYDLIYSPNKITENTFNYSHLLHNNIYDSSILEENYWQRNKTEYFTNYINNSTSDIYIHALIQIILNYVNHNFRNIGEYKEKLDWNSIDIDYLLESGESLLKKSNNKLRKTVFVLYKKLYLLIKYFYNNNYYKAYKNYLFKNIGILDNKLIDIHFTILINYCTARERISTDEKLFGNEWIELSERYIIMNFPNKSEGGYLNSIFFRNYIIKCMALSDTVKLKSFIDKYADKLSPKEFSKMMNYGMAHYYYLIHEFKNSMKCLNSIKNNLYYYKFDIINLELRIYYDNFKIELIDRAIHNYKESLKNDPYLTALEKTRLSKFIKYFKMLVNIREKTYIRKNAIDDLSILKKSISNESRFVMKNWLLRKTNDLLNNLITVPVN